VRLACERPSVLIKVGHLASGHDGSGAMVLAGPGWEARLEELLALLAPAERAGLWALRLDQEEGLPLPAEQVMARLRTGWFPEFLSSGRMAPHFQRVVDLVTGQAYGHAALLRGMLGSSAVPGDQLVAAAEAHAALFSFDGRARTAALEVGMPMLGAGERLLVDVDPRAVVDVGVAVRSTLGVVERVEGDPAALCLVMVAPGSCPDAELLADLCARCREQGTAIGLDGISGGGVALARLERLRPDVARLEAAMTAGIESSPPRRRLAGAVIEIAHELGCAVLVEGIDREAQLDAARELGADLGQGALLGRPADTIGAAGHHGAPPSLV
jgi:EAL domain-containing protein (putative c-di-GMP-specific phosphodiesterase class I)